MEKRGGGGRKLTIVLREAQGGATPYTSMLACLKSLFFKASVLIIKNLRNVRGRRE